MQLPWIWEKEKREYRGSVLNIFGLEEKKIRLTAYLTHAGL